MKKVILITIAFFIFITPLFSKKLPQNVNLVFKEADLKNVLMLFAEYTNKNFIVDERVTGKITIRLKNIPWKRALNLILDTKNLKMIENKDYIRIVPKSYFEKLQQEKLKLQNQKIKLEETKKKLAPLITVAISLNFTKVSEVSPKLSSLLSSRGKIISDQRTNTLIITDMQENINLMKQLINLLDKPTKQVIIEAKIVIIKESANKELGIQWGGSVINKLKSDKVFYGISGSVSSTGISQITDIIPPKSGGNYQTVSVPSQYIVSVPTIQAPTAGVNLIFGRWGYYNLAIKLSALKSKNLAKEISSPKVIALDNEKAVIAQGQEIPYKTVSDQGTKTEFKEAKLKLEVTPHITSNNMISLEINLAKDSMGEQTTDGPAINTQEVNTKLLLQDGETAVIGGIISKSTVKGESSVPFFSDIPIFGNFFKNNINSNIRGELLIFITPRIVKKKYPGTQHIEHLITFPKKSKPQKSQKIQKPIISKKININKTIIKEKKQQTIIPKKSHKKSIISNNAKDIYIYTKVNLNLREGPGINFKKINVIPKGTKIKLIKEKENSKWIKIKFKNNTGWVNKKYVIFVKKNIPKNKYGYTTISIKLREKPLWDSKKLKVLPKKSKVTILQYDSKNWIKVKYNNYSGWIPKSYLTYEK